MRCSSQNLFRAGLILALLLSPERLTAQGPQGVQSPTAGREQSSAVPELADLIPLATALSGRLANLAKTVADEGDLSRVEQQLGEITALVDDYARQLLALKDTFDPRAGRLPQLKAEIESAGDTLTVVSKAVTAKIRTFGSLRKEWLAEQKQWNTWQAALLKEEPLEEITATMTKAQGAIETALGLLRQQLKPLLALQEQAGALQTRINSLTAEVEDLISLSQGGALVDASPSMFSAQYVSQLAPALRAGVQTRLAQVSWPGRAFFAREGWILVLQGVLSLVLALIFFLCRQQLEQVEHWRFVAKRPVAAGLLVGILSVGAFYERVPDMLRLALSVLLGIAFVRLLEGLVEGTWRRQFVYGLPILLVLTNLCYVLAPPTRPVPLIHPGGCAGEPGLLSAVGGEQ